MVLHHLQPGFTGGEVSPSLYARTDSTAYRQWVKTAKNCFVHPQGGVSNRAGTRYVAQTKKNAPCRLIPFVIAEDESYALEMGDKYIRFYSDSGLLLKQDGTAYEITTPFPAEDLEKVNFTQHDQTLYFTHPDYAPKRLTRTGTGVFAWEDVPVKYGPFKVGNNDESKKMRITSEAQEVTSEGISASLSFQPLIYPEYMVWGYFNGEWFYAGENFGFDVSAFVNVFNNTYGSSGFRAQNLGGVIKIESPAATGGDWNGKELRIEYRYDFVNPPNLSVVQTLSGGSNTGEVIEVGDNQYFLESDFDIFSPSHVGGRFSLTHQVPAQYLTDALAYDDVSDAIYSGSDWALRTGGEWTGSLQVEVSRDLGETWSAVKTLSRASGEDNLYVTGNLADGETLFYVRVRALEISGEAGIELRAEAFLQEGVVVVREFADTRKVLVDVERNFGGSAWTADWAEGSFSPLSGYPACVFFYQDRLGFAGTAAEPQTVWFSRTGAYTDFGHARDKLLDTDAVSVNLSGKKLNAIRAVAVANRLLIFTAGSEWTLHASGALTPYNIQVEQHSERGAGVCAPVMVGNRAVYVQARGTILRNFYYDYTSSSYTSEDLTLCAKHLFFNRTIREICYQQEPDNLLWCVLDNGTLLSLTYLPEQNICAWTHHETQGQFISVCALPRQGYDEVWLAVARNGKYYVERLAARMVNKAPQEQIFLDACVSKRSATAFSEVSGLNHLEGCDVVALGDGNPVRGLKVSGGKITLPRAMNCVHVGLSYDMLLVTLPVCYEYGDGTGADRKKRLVSVTLKMLDSRGGFAGTDSSKLDEIVQRRSEPFNTPIALKTQDYQMTLRSAHELNPSLIIRQTDPLPLTLLACILRTA